MARCIDLVGKIPQVNQFIPDFYWPFDRRVGNKVIIKSIRVSGFINDQNSNFIETLLRVTVFQVNRRYRPLDDYFYSHLETRMSPKQREPLQRYPITLPFNLAERENYKILHEQYVWYGFQEVNEESGAKFFPVPSLKNIQNNTSMCDRVIDIKLNNLNLYVNWDVEQHEATGPGNIYFAVANSSLNDHTDHFVKDLNWTVEFSDPD